tara:strand:+ start:434 stop:1525 length:1092 start_codon:yes stop_codon:yes gene_type:complete
MATNGVYYDSSTGLNLTSGGSVRINIATGGGITFNSEYTFPTADGGAKEVLMTDGAGNVDFNTIPNASLDNSSVTVTAGTLLDNGGTVSLGGTITLNVDLSELPTSTTNGDGDFFAVIDTSNVQRKLTKGNINNSGFNNDAGFITSAGNTNIYGSNGNLSSLRTLSQSGNDLLFKATSAESTKIFKSNSTVATSTRPRLYLEADNSYTTVLQIRSSSNTTVNQIEGYDQNGKQNFEVDGLGNLQATSKSFLIPHPIKEGFNLRHGSLEGPEHGVYVRGKLDGNKIIELPDYWLELVDESTISVQLTPIGSHQNLFVKDIVDNTVIVGNSNILNSKIKCFYLIQAERKDIDKMLVEFPNGDSSI